MYPYSVKLIYLRMKETEIKILHISVEEIQQRLMALGAQSHGQSLIGEEAFDFPKETGMKINGLLRLRKVNETVEL